jgi:peroxiredoxin
MTNLTSKFLIAAMVVASPALWGQATEASIKQQIRFLGVVPGGPGPGGMMGGPPPAAAPGAPKMGLVPEDKRPAAIVQVAKDIDALPAGASKVELADSLVHAATQGEVGRDALLASANALAKALSETPQQPGPDGLPAKPYMDVAKLARYGGVMTSLKDPQVAKAEDILVANDADVGKLDFTLKDANGKKVVFSSLKGKIVLINFWSAPCMACRKEMQDLDLIQTHFDSQGLVILSIISPTPDDIMNLNHFLLQGAGYHPRVLLDDKGKVAAMFHVDSQPKTFVFDRDGKLVGESINYCTQRQFFAMLGKGGLHP